MAAGVANMKSLTDRPVCVGFGISTADHMAQLAGHADGGIVGSAVVRRMQQKASDPAAIPDAVAAYCRELLAKVR